MSLTASMKGAIIFADGRFPFAAAAAYEPGAVMVRPDGTLAIYDDFDGCKIGEMISPCPVHDTPVGEFAAVSGNTWAAGAVLYWDDVAKTVTTTVGSNKRVGVSVAAKTSGQLSALVNLVPA
jgi:hypothetical protein